MREANSPIMCRGMTKARGTARRPMYSFAKPRFIAKPRFVAGISGGWRLASMAERPGPALRAIRTARPREP